MLKCISDYSQLVTEKAPKKINKINITKSNVFCERISFCVFFKRLCVLNIYYEKYQLDVNFNFITRGVVDALNYSFNAHNIFFSSFPWLFLGFFLLNSTIARKFCTCICEINERIHCESVNIYFQVLQFRHHQ